MSKFNELLSKHVGTSFARQLAFADLLEGRNWSLNVQQGIATFGEDLRFPVQLLGTEAEGNNTWLWAWANEQSNLPEKVLGSCNRLRELGQKEGIVELEQRSFSLDIADGHRLALVASGVIGGCCYYRGPYDGGALFFLVTNVGKDLLQPVPAERAITVITEIISQFDVDHRVMVESFLRSQGFSIERTADDLIASRGGDALKISFDPEGSVTQVGGKIAPRQPAAKRWWEFWK